MIELTVPPVEKIDKKDRCPLLYRVYLNSIEYMQTKANKLLNPFGYHLSSEANKRLRWMYLLYYEHKRNVTKAAHKIGISRQWLSLIKSAFERHGKDPRSLEPLSKAPRRRDHRNRISQETEKAIIAVRDRYPCWGKEKISRILKRDYRLIAHPSTVNRYLHKHKKINPKLSKKNSIAWQRKKQRDNSCPTLAVKHRPPPQLKDYAPGALIEKDMKFVLKQGTFSNIMKHKAKENFYYQHTETDSFTRIRALELVKMADSAAATEAHKQARHRFPFAIAAMNTDNGGENEKDFAKHLDNTAVFHFYSGVGTPTDNPRVERSHLTDDQEFYHQGNIEKTFDAQREALRKWEYTYNYIRPHQALGYLTPIEFYRVWKQNPNEAYRIKNQYQQYLTHQKKRLATARRIKKKEQVEALMHFIDAKLNQKTNLREHKNALINCQLCSWT